MSDGGKGSAPRKKRDDEAYSKGWDAIFGTHNRQKTDEVCDKGQHNEKQRCEQTDRPNDREQTKEHKNA